MRLKRVNLFVPLCVALFLVRPATGCSLTVLRTRTRIQTPGSAKRNSRISQLGLVSCPASSGRLARLVVALGAVRFACTGRQRASAGHKVAPPRRHRSCRADAPDRSCTAAAPSSLRRAPAQTRRANPGAGARGQVRLRQRLLLECSEPGVRLAGRPRCRATQQRAPPMRGGQAVAAAGHLARCRTQSGAHRRQRARVAHKTGLSVSSRCCWCWCARCARERSGSPLDDTLSQRELPHSRHTGTLQIHVLLHMYVPCRSSFSLPSRQLKIDDVSASQF